MNNITKIPQPIELDVEDAKSAKDLVEKAAALQEFMKNMMDLGQHKQGEIRNLQAAFWSKMQQKYGIDPRTVHWAPSEDGKRLIPVSVNLSGA